MNPEKVVLRPEELDVGQYEVRMDLVVVQKIVPSGINFGAERADIYIIDQSPQRCVEKVPKSFSVADPPKVRTISPLGK